MTEAQSTPRPTPAMWLGFLAAAAVLVLGAYSPILALAAHVIG